MAAQTLAGYHLKAPEGSPNMSRLDRLLVLVTEHESTNRKQEMKVSDLNRRIVYLEDKLSSELLHIAPLQERDVARELDMARLAMEGLVKQLISMTQTMQEVQSQQHQTAQAMTDWRAAALKLEARQAALEQQVAGLQQEGARGGHREVLEVDGVHRELSSIRRQLSQVAAVKADVDDLKHRDSSSASLVASVQGTTADLRRQLAGLERQQQAAAQQLETRLDEQTALLHSALSAALEQRAQALSSEVRQEVAAARKDALVSGNAGAAALERWAHTQVGGLGSRVASCEAKVGALEASTATEHALCRQAADAATRQVEEVGQEVRRIKKHVVKWQQKFLALEGQAERSSAEAGALVAPLQGQLGELRGALVSLTAHLQQAATEIAATSRQASAVQGHVAGLAGAVCSCLERCTEASHPPAGPSSGPGSALSYLPTSLRPQPFSFHPIGNPAMASAVAELGAFVSQLQAKLGQAKPPLDGRMMRDATRLQHPDQAHGSS